jgi:hypothetical protein
MKNINPELTLDSLLLDLKAKVIKIGLLGEYTRIDRTKTAALWVGLEDPNSGFIMGTGLQAVIRPYSASVQQVINQRYVMLIAAEVTFTAHGVKFPRDFLETLTATFTGKYRQVEILFQQGTDKTLTQYSVRVFA